MKFPTVEIDHIPTPIGLAKLEPDEEIVRVLEELLAMAKTGELTAIAFSGLRNGEGGKYVNGYVLGGNLFTVVGLMRLLEREMLSHAT